MFNKAIYSTTLTSEASNGLFSTITATDTPDQSFLATLRALLRKRLPQNESMKLVCRELHIPAHDIIGAHVAQSMRWFTPESMLCRIESEHSITIVHITFPDAGEKMLEVVKANAGTGKRYMGDYVRREDLRVFYARKVNALFYTDAAEMNTVIFMDKQELKHFHTLQMMIPKYLPRLFADNPLTETEVALLKSTGTKSSVEYETLIEEFAKDIDIRSEIIRGKLAGFETVFERMRIDELRSEINLYQKDYDHYLSMARNAARDMQERKYILAGLECAINNHSGDSDMMEYFMYNKSLTVVQVNGTAIEFIVHGYADVYDVEAFEQYVGNHRGYMFHHLNPAITKMQMEKLYRAIFSESIYKLRICAAYTADMQHGLSALRNYVFPPESQTYLHNPHIQQFGCIGGYETRFQEFLHRRDYIGAIDQAAVSARNLDFYDSTVMAVFAKDLSHTALKCIEKSGGVLLTPKEAIIELERGAVYQDQ